MTSYKMACLWWCVVLWLCTSFCLGLVLERRPRRIPEVLSSDEGEREIASGEEEDSSVEKKRLKQQTGQLSPLMMKPTWKALYPFGASGRREAEEALEDKKSRTQHRKRSRREEGKQKEQEELASILKDEEDERGKQETHKPKTKRGTEIEELEVQPTTAPDFQNWLRQEYYRNMAKSFASMRRKREDSSQWNEEDKHENEAPSTTPLKRKRRDPKINEKKRKGKRSVSFEEVTDNLRALEDALFLDALGTLAENPSTKGANKARIEADLSSAYDLETMRGALFRLRETLGGGEAANDQPEDIYLTPVRKRSSFDDVCPPLDLLTSHCSALSDLLPHQSDGLQKSIFQACNWHEVCYTCGSAYDLGVDACDSGFVQQLRSFCLDDSEVGTECDNPAPLLLVPLRQRRIFFQRSNPQLCLADTCLGNYLLGGEEL